MPQLAPLAAALMLALPAQAQWKVTPSLTLGQTYTDNVGLQSDANKRSDWVTEATPGIAVYGQNSRVQLSARAGTSFYKYSDGQPTGTRSNNSQYDASGRVKVIDEFMYVDASARSSTQAISAFGLLGKEALRQLEGCSNVNLIYNKARDIPGIEETYDYHYG